MSSVGKNLPVFSLLKRCKLHKEWNNCGKLWHKLFVKCTILTRDIINELRIKINSLKMYGKFFMSSFFCCWAVEYLRLFQAFSQILRRKIMEMLIYEMRAFTVISRTRQTFTNLNLQTCERSNSKTKTIFGLLGGFCGSAIFGLLPSICCCQD